MCGIAGVLHRDGRPVVMEVLERMARRLRHRGPDDWGVRAFDGAGLAHTRLSIIDLSPSGHQPMSSADGSTWVVFNGEIYDFQRQRAALEQTGLRFRSRTDTEVILHTYASAGLAGLAQLKGMFAFALWDERLRRLVLARDRTGKKPLYVYEKGQTLAFASELKALWGLDGVDDTVRAASIPEFLSYGYVPGPATFHAFVTKLEPGTFRVLEPGSDEVIRYFTYPRTTEDPPSFDEAVREVRRLTEAAVERRLVSDVPVGAFLSGGVDSSVVVSVMARRSAGRVRTFSLGFDGDARYDESRWAREVAAALGTQHTELRVGSDCFGMLPDILDQWDEPFGDASAIPTSIVSRLARQHTTVALTGDGGDELFGGYERFTSTAYAQLLPAPLRAAVGRLAERIPLPSEREGRLARAIRFARRVALDLPARLHSWVAVFPPDELARILRSPPPELRPYATVVAEEEAEDVINLLLRINARTYLQEDLNVKLDRATMAHGLEARCPFLDADLVDYVFRLPGAFKISRGRRKWILRQAFGGDVPTWVFERRKMGFGLPLGSWFRGPLAPFVDDLLRPRDASLNDWLDPSAVVHLLDEHADGRRDHGHRIWALLMLESWLRRRRGRGADSSSGSFEPRRVAG